MKFMVEVSAHPDFRIWITVDLIGRCMSELLKRHEESYNVHVSHLEDVSTSLRRLEPSNQAFLCPISSASVPLPITHEIFT